MLGSGPLQSPILGFLFVQIDRLLQIEDFCKVEILLASKVARGVPSGLVSRALLVSVGDRFTCSGQS